MPGLLLRGVLALTSGAAAAFAFEPYALSFLAPLAVAGLSVAVAGVGMRRGFALGTVFGLAFMVLLLPWLTVIGPDAWIGLSLLEALFFGALGAALVAVSTLRAAPVWAAALWVAAEALRSAVPWGGFPWGRLAFATIDTPLAAAMAYVGTAGTTFLVALVGTATAWAVLRRRAGGSRPAPLPGLLAVAATLALAGSAALLPAAPGAAPALPGDGPTVQVAAVQGDVPGKGMDAFAERRAVLDNHVNATERLAGRVAAGTAPRPDLVLWPENSTDIDPFTDPSVHADIQRAVDAVGVPVLVGAMVGGPGPIDVSNQGIVWSPGSGPGASYAKRHPVPFGEYIPMRAQLARVFERLDQIPRDMVPGTEPGLLDVAGVRLGDVICFEVAYDGLVRDVVRGGAQLLVVQTNNATYMGTGQVEQQFAIARLRAVETGRWVVVVATNGVSGLVDPSGRVVERAPTREPAVIEASIPLAAGLTPAVRFGVWVERGLLAVGAAAVLAGVLSRRRHADLEAAAPRRDVAMARAAGDRSPSLPGETRERV